MGTDRHISYVVLLAEVNFYRQNTSSTVDYCTLPLGSELKDIRKLHFVFKSKRD